MKQQFTQEKNIRWIFRASVLLKAANALLEIVSGTLLLFTSSIATLVTYLSQKELIEDPGDIIAATIQNYLPYLSEHSQSFAAFYLLSHGGIKIFLAIGLLRNKLWAYPSAIIFFILFIIYQVYRYTYTHSFILIFLTIFDLIIVGLTWHEYRIVKKTLGR